MNRELSIDDILRHEPPVTCDIPDAAYLNDLVSQALKRQTNALVGPQITACNTAGACVVMAMDAYRQGAPSVSLWNAAHEHYIPALEQVCNLEYGYVTVHKGRYMYMLKENEMVFLQGHEQNIALNVASLWGYVLRLRETYSAVKKQKKSSWICTVQ